VLLVALVALVAASPILAAEPASDPHYTLSNPVPANELRPLCPDNPGFGVPPCIIDAGHLMVELTAVTASFNSVAGVKSSDYALGKVLLRLGVNNSLEAYASWTPLSIDTTSDQGQHRTNSTTGSFNVGVKQSLRNPDGAGLSVAVQPGVSIPSNGSRVSLSLALPVSQALGGGWSLGFTPEVDALPDSIGSGTHLGGSVAMSVSYSVSAFTLSAEAYLAEDRDPVVIGHLAVANFSLSWVPPRKTNLSLYIGADFGLNGAPNDAEFYCGLSRRF